MLLAASVAFCLSVSSYGRYVGTSLERLGLPPLSDEERADLARDEAAGMAQWRRVVAYYVLRQLFAPLYEVRTWGGS